MHIDVLIKINKKEQVFFFFQNESWNEEENAIDTLKNTLNNFLVRNVSVF